MKSTDKHEIGKYEDKLYFNSTRNYTLALLNAFNDVPWYVQQEAPDEKRFTVPITFGNYEKAVILEDLDEKEITKQNFNFLPRLILTFDGMTKAADRQTQKYQKFTKEIPGSNDLEFSYNSLAYDFGFTLLLQTRGLTAATQITESILAKFNPTLTIDIQEFPLFDPTQTQIQISDPSFEILDSFAENEVNVINVTFEVNIRGNIYSPIGIKGTIETSGFYMRAWNSKDLHDTDIAGYFEWDADHAKNMKYKQVSADENNKLAGMMKLDGITFKTAYSGPRKHISFILRSPGVYLYDWLPADHDIPLKDKE